MSETSLPNQLKTISPENRKFILENTKGYSIQVLGMIRFIINNKGMSLEDAQNKAIEQAKAAEAFDPDAEEFAQTYKKAGDFLAANAERFGIKIKEETQQA